MNDDMHVNDIPNSMIYDLITKLDTKIESSTARLEAKIDRLEEKTSADFAKVDANFARLEAKIDNLETKVDRNDESLDAKIDSSTARLEAKIDKNTELVNQLYQRGDKLELRFSRNVLLGNSALAGIVAFFVALFTGRMIMEN